MHERTARPVDAVGTYTTATVNGIGIIKTTLTYSSIERTSEPVR